MLPIKIAYRFLKNRKGQTLLIASAVAIGVSIQIFLGLLIQNLQSGLIDTTIGETSHITVKAEENGVIEKGREINELVKNSDSKIVTSVEVLDRPGLVSNEDISIAVLIRGFNLEQGDNIYKLNEKYVEGNAPKGKNEVAIGQILAEDLGVTSGDKINILTPQNKKIEVTVSGVLDLKVQALNKSYVATNIENLREMYGLSSDAITSVETQLSNKDIFSAEEVSGNIKNALGGSLVVSNWIEQNESLLSGLKGQSASSYTIQVFIVISVLVAIASILAITVLQKTKQIGILKAMGITDKKASLVFIVQGGLLGVFGAILGSTLGVALFKTFQALVKNSDGTPLISGGVNINFVILSAVIAIVACIISSIVPAIKSLRLNPVEAIKL